MSDSAYYRILYDEDGGEICVVCLQWFDEFDYDESKWVTKQKFEDRESAVYFLEQNKGRTDIPFETQKAIREFLSRQRKKRRGHNTYSNCLDRNLG